MSSALCSCRKNHFWFFLLLICCKLSFFFGAFKKCDKIQFSRFISVSVTIAPSDFDIENNTIERQLSINSPTNHKLKTFTKEEQKHSDWCFIARDKSKKLNFTTVYSNKMAISIQYFMLTDQFVFKIVLQKRNTVAFAGVFWIYISIIKSFK